MVEKAMKLVQELLKNEDSGHGMEHITRVYELAMGFAKTENCDRTLVALGAILHDADDYKLFGDQNQENLTNTNRILNEIGADNRTKNAVLDIVANIGYTKRLKGKSPKSIEGMIVSDADMCDAIGANGLLRTHKYSLKHGNDFFNKDAWPVEDMDASRYTRKCSDSATCHVFEKLLKLKGLMLTTAGKEEAKERHEFMIAFLRQLFKEENAKDWDIYLDKYLKDNNC